MGVRWQAVAVAVLGPTVAVAASFAPHVFVVTSDTREGNTAVLGLAPPWPATPAVEPIGAQAIVRHFFGKHYVVNRDLGTVQVIDPATFDTALTFSVGASSTPHDIAVIGSHKAYVTRYDDTLLFEVDPTDGSLKDTIDLAPFADADGLPEMSMMARDGKRLLVQLQRLDRNNDWTPVPPSYLAVIDVETNEVLDTQPLTAGVQPIVLTGLKPSFKMTVEPASRRLFVSEPGEFMGGAEGGIEVVQLDQLKAQGFVTTEGKLMTLDIGAFVMVSPLKGYAVTHTELVESTHVTAFSRITGTPVAQIYTSLFGSVRNLDYDPATSQVFFPDHTPDVHGVVVFDTVTDSVASPAPIQVGLPPTDAVVVRPVTPGSVHDLLVWRGLGGFFNLIYEPACGAADHNVVFGPLAAVSRYGYSGRVCGIGNLGQFEGFDPGPGSFFFMVVGTDGESVVGSYGLDSEGDERPPDRGDPRCAFTQDLSESCD